VAARIRRPKAHAKLLERLCEGSGNPFNHFYEVLVFSAALGFARDQRIPFEDSDEPIRWEQFEVIDGATPLVDMLAVAAISEEREILSAEREETRFKLFEEYANGGLAAIAAAIEAQPAKTAREVVLDLVLSEQKTKPADLDFASIVESLD
jgi:dnd system-associated protein 4